MEMDVVVVMKCFLHDHCLQQVGQGGREQASLPDTYCCFEEFALPDSSSGLHCWSCHIVLEWLEPGLPLC